MVKNSVLIGALTLSNGAAIAFSQNYIYRQSVAVSLRATVENPTVARSCGPSTVSSFALSAVRIDPFLPEVGLRIQSDAKVASEFGSALTISSFVENNCGLDGSRFQGTAISNANCEAIGTGPIENAGECLFSSCSVVLYHLTKTWSCCIPLAAIVTTSQDFEVTTPDTVKYLARIESVLSGKLPLHCAPNDPGLQLSFPLGRARRSGCVLGFSGNYHLFEVRSSADGNSVDFGQFVLEPDGKRVARPEFTSTGNTTVRCIPFVLSENDLDVNSDGAVDSSDVSSLTASIGSSDPDLLARFNFVSPSGQTPVIDPEDVEVLSVLIASGLGHGRFGDLNRDGLIDCRDAYDAKSHFATAIGSGNYRIECDLNLDGIVDQQEKQAYFALVNFADFSKDGFVDDEDFLIFVEAYDVLDDSRGDMNGDDVTDDADFSLFAVRYDEFVC